MAANCGNLIVSRVSINFTLHGELGRTGLDSYLVNPAVQKYNNFAGTMIVNDLKLLNVA